MNIHRLAPSMSMLLAFDAAARHCSFTRASDELSLTQSAVSRQIQALEELLEVKLFERDGRHIRLTEVGVMYAQDIAPALARISGASARVGAFRKGVSSLNLAILPTFGERWLMPKLGMFYRHHPGVMLHLHTRIGEYDITELGMDAAINVGVDPWPGLISHPLVDEEMVLVASPDALARQPIREPVDVCGHLLLQIAVRSEAWHHWFTAQGLPSGYMRLGPHFEFSAHMIQAATAGIGIALVARCLVTEELQDGRLVLPLNAGLDSRRHYSLLYPPEKSKFPPLATFRDWLLAYSDSLATDMG
ncbi:LysR substrate-binding domain-containing protein [Chromohalobacter sp. HP20-39]|uniref:LysR substrate-binding domain-containing protein n=1 Tax=Chromohalobacter sp. HP20-39 TaxID=3079306 RepID=UPI00294B89FE|nr:LysR substrate-binding domain-containing protein [Chromohalobacter sp. HP20-39]MDV6317435.1 LysR substrate-binding domain-containing protein [Chromohalobacter sp. HP20-39]